MSSPAGARSPLLEAIDIARTYRDGAVRRRVLDGVSLRVGAGEMVAVMGPSGAGKSTLLHLLGGLEQADAGRILWQGRSIGDLGERQLATLRRRWIGFVFQEALLLPTLSAAENLSLAAKLARVGPEAYPGGPFELLREVGVEERAGHRPEELSGGEAQRVALARALIKSPAILLADEPTASLDRRAGDEIVALIERLCAQRGFACVIVTHDRHVAGAAARRYALRAGRLHEERGR